MANSIGWGSGVTNNTIDWQDGSNNTLNNWGEIYPNSNSPETQLES